MAKAEDFGGFHIVVAVPECMEQGGKGSVQEWQHRQEVLYRKTAWERGKYFTIRHFLKKASGLKPKSHNIVTKRGIARRHGSHKGWKRHLSKQLFSAKPFPSPWPPMGAHLGKGLYLSSWNADPKPFCPGQVI